MPNTFIDFDNVQHKPALKHEHYTQRMIHHHISPYIKAPHKFAQVTTNGPMFDGFPAVT